MHLNPDKKIKICKGVREYARQALLRSVREIIDKNLKPSEAGLRDMWLSELGKNTAIHKDCWYSPPPHGIGILFADDTDGRKSRLNYKSLRPKEMWPRKDIHLDTKTGIVYAYASPFDKDTGIIGDLGITLYFGKNKKIMDHLVLCHKIVHQVFEYSRPGLTFSQLAVYTKSLISSYGLNNEIECKTDPSPADDVGHTIPFVMESLTKKESDILQHESSEEISRMISEKRIYVRASADQVIKKGMAFTIEPRPRVIDDPDIPMVSFHSICAIHEDGEKELITGFDDLFGLVGMDYMR